MPKIPDIFLDRFSEVFDLPEPWATDCFYDFAQVGDHSDSVYIVGRQNLINNLTRFKEMASSDQYHMIFCNACEGSWTMEAQIRQLRLGELLDSGHVSLISAAPVQQPCLNLTIDHFLMRIMDFPENREAQAHTASVFATKSKPYKFLFLNGRARPHRKYLYERLRRKNLLEHSLYTMLDAKPTVVRHFRFTENGQDVMATVTDLRRLPDHYEVPRYRDPVFGPITDTTNLKQELFRREWGEIYLEPKIYIDSYFSLVTETVCAESSISFRTEKIAKPLAMGHPFIVAANPGFLRDLRRLGFRTFAHVIDESYDQIQDPQQRMDTILDIVHDLCQQDLDSFTTACQDVCKYNQQHLDEFTRQERRDFPDRFLNFIAQHG